MDRIVEAVVWNFEAVPDAHSFFFEKGEATRLLPRGQNRVF